MTRITRWHTAWGWALAACWLVGSIMAVSAQDGRWERVTAAGVQAGARDGGRRAGLRAGRLR